MTDEHFDDYIEHCYKKIEIKQEELSELYGIGYFEEYWYSQENSSLQFLDNGKVKLEFDVVFIGSWSSNTDSWMWSWGNNSMTKRVRKRSANIMELKTLTGLEAFVTPSFQCDEPTSQDLAVMAVDYLGAKGLYKSYFDDGKKIMYMAIMSPTRKALVLNRK